MPLDIDIFSLIAYIVFIVAVTAAAVVAILYCEYKILGHHDEPSSLIQYDDEKQKESYKQSLTPEALDVINGT